MKAKALITIACLTLSLLASSVLFIKIAQAQTTTMSVEPQTITNPSLVPGTTFEINITVNNVTELYGWEFKLYYLRAVLNLTLTKFGPFLETGGTTFTIDKSNQNLNSTHGLVWLADSLLGAPSGVNGSGTIASAKFKVNQIGSTKLDLTGTKLGTPSGETIAHEANDGYFSNTVSHAELSVSPPSVINSTLGPGTDFTVNITIKEAANLNGWEFKLFYDRNILNASSVEFGTFLQSAGPTNQLIKELADDYNETHGIVWLSETLLSPVSVTGDGVLAHITFHVEGVGESNLCLQDTMLTDPAGHPLDHTSSNGYFNNVLMAKIFIDPPEIFDPTLTPGAQVNVTVKITEVVNLYGFRFNMSFEKEMLNCLGILIIPYNNEINYDAKVAWDDSTGEVYVEVMYHSPATPITSFTPFEVAKIFFQISAMGISPLHFHDTTMVDNEGAEIPHVTQDGLIYVVIRDVAVTNVVKDRTSVYPGEIINITVTAKNKGNLTETFTIMLRYNGNLITNLTINSLAPDAEQTLSYAWNTTGFPPCYNASVVAYAVPVPYELNLGDNTFTDGIVNITLIGDVNADGTVDVFDLTLVATGFSSSQGDPEYNARSDINHDGMIDIYDLILIGLNFGAHY